MKDIEAIILARVSTEEQKEEVMAVEEESL